MKKIIMLFCALTMMFNAYSAPPVIEEVYVISNNTTLTFNEETKLFTIFMTDNDKTFEIYKGDKISTIKFINDIIFDAFYRKEHYYSISDSLKTVTIFINIDDNIVYDKDIVFYKMKKIILNTRIK